MKRNKKLKLFSLFFLILFCIYFQSIVYSAISSKLTITGDSVARIRSNVRINSFKIYEVSDGVISSYEDFSKSYTMSNVTLPYSDSYIIYELVIGNYEDVEMQLHSITGLNSNLVYELIDYNLNDSICDSTGKCFDGVEKTLYLKIKYTTFDSTSTNYNVNLEYEFKEFSNVITVGSTFKTMIPSIATHLVFTDEKPANNVTLTDVSLDQDMGVVGYLDGTTYKVSTRRTGVIPEANSDSSYMFNGSALTNIDLDNLDITGTTNIIGMFQDCTNLLNIDFGSEWDTSNITQMKYLFKNCSSLTTIDLSGFNTDKVESFSNFFNGCSSLLNIDLSNFNTAKSSSFGYMFNDCALLETIDVSNFDVSSSTSFQYMFNGCSNLKNIDVSNFKISKNCKLSFMFAYCTNLETINANNLVNSYVTSIGAMFYDDSALINLYIDNWDTSSVTSIYGIFKNNASLTELNLSNWNVENVTDATWVFESCKNIISLNLSGWKFESTVKLNGMFHGMRKLEYLNVDNWDTSMVYSFNSLFVNNYALKILDLSSWNTSNVTDMSRMFHNNDKLEKVYVGDGWDTSNVTSSDEMFYRCIKLCNFDSNYLDATKAYVGDGGYLTKLSFFELVGYGSVQFVYEVGMTWNDWVNSDFSQLVVGGDVIYFSSTNDIIHINIHDTINDIKMMFPVCYDRMYENLVSGNDVITNELYYLG